MFRTKVDLDLKIQGRGGSPFFNLRETIAMILSGHVEQTEVKLFLKNYRAGSASVPRVRLLQSSPTRNSVQILTPNFMTKRYNLPPTLRYTKNAF